MANAAVLKILEALAEKLDEVDKDPDHPLRHWFNRTVQEFIADLRTDPDLKRRIKSYQEQIARNSELSAYVDGIWQDLHDWLKLDLLSSNSKVRANISSMTASFGASLLQNKAVLTAVNNQVAESIPVLLEEVRPKIGTFISSKMKEWKEHEIVKKLELNIGKDLQFIRLNGTFVGGIIGLLIHTVTAILH